MYYYKRGFKLKRALQWVLSLQLILGTLPLSANSQNVEGPPLHSSVTIGEETRTLAQQTYRIIESGEMGMVDKAINSLNNTINSNTEGGIWNNIKSGAAKLSRSALSGFSSNYSGEQQFNISRGEILRPYTGVPTDISRLSVRSDVSSDGRSDSVFIEMVERDGRIHQHEISGFGEITAKPVLNPYENIVLFATKESGIYALPLRIFQNSVFKDALVPLHVMGKPPMDNAKIVGIRSERLYQRSDVEEALEKEAYRAQIEKSSLLRGDSNIEGERIMRSADVVVTWQWTTPSGDVRTVDSIVDLQDLSKVMIDKLQAIYAGSVIISGDATRFELVKRLMQEKKEFTEKIFAEINRLVGDKSGKEVFSDLGLLALSKFSSSPYAQEGIDRAFPVEISRSDMGAGEKLETIYGQDRDAFTVEELRQSRQVIDEANAERERVEAAAQSIEDEFERRKSGATKDGVPVKQWAGAQLRGAFSAYYYKFSILYQRYVHESSYSWLAKAAIAGGAVGSLYNAGVVASETGFAPEMILEYHQLILESFRNLAANANETIKISMDYITAGIKAEHVIASTAFLLFGIQSSKYLFHGYYGFLPLLLRLKGSAGKTWSNIKVAYQGMKIFFANVNYGIQARYREGLIKDQLTYRLLDAGLNPKMFGEDAKTNWRTTPEELKRKSERINAQMEAMEMAKQRAAQLSALVIVAKTKGIDMGSLEAIRHLLDNNKVLKENGFNEATVTISQYMRSPEYLDAWKSIRASLDESFRHMIVQFGELRTESASAIEAEAILKYVKQYKQASEQINEVAKKDGVLSRILSGLANRTSAAKENVGPMIQYTNDFRQFSLDERSGVISEKTAITAKRGIDRDIFLSFTFIMPAMDMESFIGAGKIAAMFVAAGFSAVYGPAYEIVDAIRSTMNFAEFKEVATAVKPFVVAIDQLLLAGTVGVMQAEVDSASDEIKMERDRLRLQLFEKEGLSKQQSNEFKENLANNLRYLYESAGVSYTDADLNMTEKRDSFKTGFSALIDDVDKNADKYFKHHLKIMKNVSGSAAQGQLAIGAFTFTVSNLMSAALAAFVGFSAAASGAEVNGSLLESTFMGVMSAFSMLVMKHTFLGYAYTWNYAHAMYHAVIGRLESMNKSLNRFSGLIFEGVRLDRPKQYQFAAMELIKIYEQTFSAKILEERGIYQRGIQKEDITAEMATKLVQTVVSEPPLPNKANRWIDWGVNGVIGAGLSTALSIIPVIGLYTVFVEILPDMVKSGMNPYFLYTAYFAGAMAFRSANVQLLTYLSNTLKDRRLSETQTFMLIEKFYRTIARKKPPAANLRDGINLSSPVQKERRIRFRLAPPAPKTCRALFN